MIRRGRGKIVNMSGGGATSPFPRFTAYAVSKAAVVRFTETLAVELADYNIQVNAVAPGFVATRIHKHTLEAGEKAGPDYLRKTQEQLAAGGVDRTGGGRPRGRSGGLHGRVPEAERGADRGGPLGRGFLPPRAGRIGIRPGGGQRPGRVERLRGVIRLGSTLHDRALARGVRSREVALRAGARAPDQEPHAR